MPVVREINGGIRDNSLFWRSILINRTRKNIIVLFQLIYRFLDFHGGVFSIVVLDNLRKKISNGAGAGLLRLSTPVSNQEIYGPGACYRSHLVKDGWLWDGLCEDADAMADLTARGYKTGYCEEAQIYEEEPNRVGIFVRQQMRWTKGLWHTFFTFGPRLVKSFFKKPTWSKYDIFWQIFPYSQVTFFFGLTYQIISLILFGVYGDNGFNWWSFGNYVLTLLGGIYVTTFLLDLVTIIREWKRFHLPLGKTIVYLFLFPLYQIINLPVSTAAVFMRVKWKHIDHHFVIDPTLLVEEEKAKNSKKPASAKQ